MLSAIRRKSVTLYFSITKGIFGACVHRIQSSKCTRQSIYFHQYSLRTFLKDIKRKNTKLFGPRQFSSLKTFSSEKSRIRLINLRCYWLIGMVEILIF